MDPVAAGEIRRVFVEPLERMGSSPRQILMVFAREYLRITFRRLGDLLGTPKSTEYDRYHKLRADLKTSRRRASIRCPG
jgi:hypothetical protein